MDDDKLMAAVEKIFPSPTWWYRLKRAAQFFWQRRTRGWDDSETWNFEHTIALFILPRLRRYRELIDSHPADLTWEEWLAVLDKMIRAFDLTVSEWDEEKGTVEADSQEEVGEGLALFAKWFEHLWD